MQNIGPNIHSMGDQQYHSHLENCDRVCHALGKCIDTLMHYIFQGKCRNKDEWENLHQAVTHAVFMRHYLASNLGNLIVISEDFIDQLEDWLQEVDVNPN